MRSVVITITALILTACGGGSPTDAPPVIVTPVPAVVSVSAGDGQQAVPGANVPIKPVVTVKDAAGRPMSGVAVLFAIDSGGGTVQASSATTATDGTASPGDWKLGPTEARNVLRVTAGSLTPVKLVAIGAMASVTIADQTVGNGGGTIAVTTAASPMNGLKIVVPPGAFPGGQTIGITYGSNLRTEVPPGSVAISPLLTVRVSDGGWSPRPLFVTIPVSTPPGMRPTVLLVDPATGRRQPLSTVSFDASSVTAVTAHLNGALIMGADGSFGNSRIAAGKIAARTATETGFSNAVVIALPTSLLEQDHDSGFRPGTDNWEFRPIGTAAAPSIQTGMVSTEAWYYLTQKRSGGPLWKKYQEADGIEESNRRGLRWVSAASVALRNRGALEYAEIYSTIVLDIGSRNPGKSNEFLELLFSFESFNSVRTALTITPGSPQRVVMFSRDKRASPVAVLVFRSTGRQLFAVDPGNPAKTLLLDFSDGTMVPVTPSGLSGEYDIILAEGFSLLGDMPILQSQWASVVDGTIGDDIFPTYKLKVGWGATAPETADLKAPVYVFGDPADRIAVWADCVTCLGNVRPTTFPPGSAQVAPVAAWTRAAATGPWVDLGVGSRVLLENPNNAVGLAVFSRLSGSEVNDWTDWVSFPAQKLPATIAPTAPTADANADLALTLTVTGAPANLEYVWEFADGTAPATTTVPNVTHKWTSAGSYVTKVTARDKTTKQPVAKATTTTTIGGGIKWRLDQFAITARTCPGACSEVSFAEFERLAVTPGSGVLYAYPTAVTPSLGPYYPTPGIYLAVAPRGVTTPPVPWAPATNVTWPLGDTFVGQSAGGFPISNSFAWTGGNSSGTIVGAASPVGQVSNDFRFTIDATKAGNTISGTMTMVQRTRPSLAVVFAYTATFRGQVLP
jgi:hypothetical protein